MIDNPAPHRVICAARRSRKTDFLLKWLINRATEDPRPDPVIYFGRTYHHAKQTAWDRLLRLIRAQPVNILTSKNDTELKVELLDNRVIYLMGEDSVDEAVLRGIGPKAVAFDEYAYGNIRVWDRVVRPALADKEPEAEVIFASSPRGNNHFRKLFDYGWGDNPARGWKSFWFTAEQAGVIPPARLRSFREGPTAIPQEYYDQEYNAMFLGYIGQCINQFVPRPYPDGNYLPFDGSGGSAIHWQGIAEKGGLTYFCALDWGTANEAVCGWFVCDSEGRCIQFDELGVVGHTVPQFVQKIRERRPDVTPEFYILDRSAWRMDQSKGEELDSISRQFDECGITVTKSDSRFPESISRMNTMCQMHEDRLPGFMIVEGTSPRTSYELQTMEFKPDTTGDRAEDLAKKHHNYFDMVRYAIMARLFAFYVPPQKESTWEDFQRSNLRLKTRHGKVRYHEISGIPLP